MKSDSVPVKVHDALGDERARILVVDDDERNLLALQTVLEDVADVVLARSGEEALRHLLKGEFAVILLDVYMPVMDGYETAQIIRAREQTKRIPIIFLSAVNKETEHLIRGYSMGAVDYVFKPVEPVVLQSKVAVFVDLYQMRREIQRKARAEQLLLDENLRANAELLRTEQQLRLAEQRQLAIIESLPIMLYLEDPNASPRVPKYVSGNFKVLTGFEFDDLQHSPELWRKRLHPDDRQRAEQAMAGRAAGQGLAVEYRWQCADGSYKHFLDQAVIVRDAEGRPFELAGTLLDVTDRKELEIQLLQSRKMDAIGKLTGGIAHDFNNLLAAVLGGLGMIERRVTLEEDQRKIITMTKRAAEQGAELVARLLAFARKQRLEPAPIDVAALAGAVNDLLAHTLGGLTQLQWNTDSDVWHAYADDAQLELALVNLIINARDAMPQGGTITVSVSNQALAHDQAGLQAGSYVVFEVADTGSGIAPDLIERVMEPFFTTKPVGKGTGLGLSMVYGFAQQSGGAMRIDSRLDEGTKVQIWLPRAPEALTQLVELESPTLPMEPAKPHSILLVDDHEGVRATSGAMLSDIGHRVTTAGDGFEALKLLSDGTWPVDVLITDYAMPQLAGTELVRRARKTRPGLPAIIITGNANAADLGELGDGMALLFKPFTADQMQRSIAALVRPPREKNVA
ncbi:response regulator [Rhizorhabdus argentea]|uniref:response regulator n=1 Tax=Rhizorhabdus argentea TaxID=1387174 RepID=UPI0030EE1399